MFSLPADLGLGAVEPEHAARSVFERLLVGSSYTFLLGDGEVVVLVEFGVGVAARLQTQLGLAAHRDRRHHHQLARHLLQPPVQWRLLASELELAEVDFRKVVFGIRTVFQ